MANRPAAQAPEQAADNRAHCFHWPPWPAPIVFLKRLLLVVVGLVVLATLYFWAAMSWSYSSGERAGWVQKLSKKGWVCKTWEGELAMVSLPGAAPEKFYFTI